jgi:PTH1 family peptidyl-tRNA hydrolase
MKLIVGLGNPGTKFERTRHNVGFMVVDELALRMEITSWSLSKKAKAVNAWTNVREEKVELLKPQTYMNESGLSVSYAINKHKELKIDDLYVVYDDLDITLGEYKLQKGKGPREHKGLLSIYDRLGTKDFWHVRVGVDNRSSDLRISGDEYVLQRFTDSEMKIVNNVLKEVSIMLLSEVK